MKSTIQDGGRKMPDSDAKKRWDKENVVFVAAKLFKNSDSDIIQFLEGKTRSEVVKQGLRLLMAQEGFVYTPPTDGSTDEGE